MLTPAAQALLHELADGRFHSGTALAARLGISRAAVWKRIRQLQAAGVPVTSVPGRGYRLYPPLELLDPAAIARELQTLGAEVTPELTIHACVPSTNAWLLARAGGLPKGSVCLAEAQTAGRGRLGRRWVSPFGCHLYLSLLWRFEDAAAAAGLSLAVGVAVRQGLLRLGVEGIELKWPNDLLWQGSKLAGILIEAVSEQQGPCSLVIGVGVNGTMPAAAARQIDQPWVDLHTLLGHAPPRNRLAACVIAELLALLHAYEEAGPALWLERWRAHNCVLGRSVSVQQGARVYTATAVDVAPDGALVLVDAAGRQHKVNAGDVKLRLGA
ncbi:BirA family transcriptional regulator, biotin operon repressor/biotin---[acetyl-CoA-carboxylase] ligase [Methylomarinovum caldicuralii]|uniref:Bifunctional ligase/repressor BirA n=1 Tax=Methylomarinovum caldicuralii TaxID=438856 RepID=A0AAU9C3G7_9GAMM|nr:bifunctional biotin--[acetyl-CoA-carboxylase] ligase/biotin operon repressor BirA [Methylomarinovum caldicuralii]BCX82997.1 BirA family transcriptional regulator, biotin operon repressor/biotin---[acetyl-CoA-carboxylase] ligase [Methylomarinovum caldicuralii]